MRAYEFIIEGKILSQQDKADLQSQSDYGGEDPDAKDEYGYPKQKGVTVKDVFGIPNIPDEAIASGLGSVAAMGSLAGIKSAGKTITSTPANTKKPAIQNIVVPPEIGLPKSSSGVSLSGRTATKPEDVTHAYRNMSPAELLHAQKNGAFLPNPNTKVAKTWNTNHKYWSSGDEQGHFGRDWKNSSDAAKVRVPIGKVSSDTAVNAGHAEVFNRKTGAWMPVVSGLPKK